MSLVKCPECGKEVSTEAKLCPHCGYPLEKKESKKKVIEAEVVPSEKELKKEPSSGDRELVAHYQEEVNILRKRRNVMVTWGIVLSVVSLIALIVFSILFSLGIVKEAASGDPVDPAKITGITLVYFALIIVFAFVFEGGIVLILVGAIPNSIKITKRENKIRALQSK